ncbi:MAG: hypothetical protein N2651_08525 [Fimbriimonadales bacterium]|nr:hypothetical protein [Fimbriimonadales bacterium]
MHDGAQPSTPQPFERLTVAQLVRLLSSKDGRERAAATKELFRRGRRIAPDLRKAGAKPIATVSPPRLDVVYSLIQGLPQGNYRTDSFGLHMEPKTSREEVEALGEKYSFVLPPEEPFDTRYAPNCYVRLRRGVQLEAILRALLSNEPKVVTVNLNYYER